MSIESDEAFYAWAKNEPQQLWAKHDLHGVKLGWDAGREYHQIKVASVLGEMKEATDEQWARNADQWMKVLLEY